jgi:hypothetical protein
MILLLLFITCVLAVCLVFALDWAIKHLEGFLLWLFFVLALFSATAPVVWLSENLRP